MHPVLFEIFGIKIHTYGAFIALGFIAGYLWMYYSARRLGERADQIADLAVWVLISGVIGARLLFVIVQWGPKFQSDPLSIVKIWEGGLVLYGGIIAAIIVAWRLIKKKGLDFHRVGDVAMPCLMLGLAIGRWGCLMVGCCYGRPAPDLPWAIRFPDVPDSMLKMTHPDLIGKALHPAQIYMSLNAFIIFLILTLVQRRRRFEGQVLYLSLILYAATRSIIELFRGDREDRVYFGPLSTSQWISIAVAAFAIAMYIVRQRKAAVQTGS